MKISTISLLNADFSFAGKNKHRHKREELSRTELQSAVNSKFPLSTRERETIARLHGLNGHTPLSKKAAAKELGASVGVISNRDEKGIHKLNKAKMRDERRGKRLDAMV